MIEDGGHAVDAAIDQSDLALALFGTSHFC